MKNNIFKLFILLLLTCNAYAGDVDNRLILEKLNNIENRLDTLDKRIDDTKHILNQRIDDTNKQIEHLRGDVNSLRDGIYQILFLFFFAIVAIIIWDRRSSLNPVLEKIDRLNEKVFYMWDHFGFGNKGAKIVKPA